MAKKVAVFYGALRTYQQTLPGIIKSFNAVVDEVIFFVWDNELNQIASQYLLSFRKSYPQIKFEIIPLPFKDPTTRHSPALWYNIYGFVMAIENIIKKKIFNETTVIIRIRYDLIISNSFHLPLSIGPKKTYTVNHEWLPRTKVGFDGFFISRLYNLEILAKTFRHEIIECNLNFNPNHIFNKVPELYFFKRVAKVNQVQPIFQKIAILRQSGEISAPFGVKLQPMQIIRGFFYCLKYSKLRPINMKEFF